MSEAPALGDTPPRDKAQRDKPWIFRTYAGHSTAQDSNALYRKNLAKGQTGLSVAFDLPTQTGYDSDHAQAKGEVGKVGVPICHLGDMRALFDGIPLASMNTSMTINATAAWLMALYVAVADEQGTPRDRLTGTNMSHGGSHGDHVAGELVSEDDGKPRQARIADVAVGVGLEEMQIRSAEADPPQLDDDVARSGLRHLEFLELGPRVAPHAAPDERFSCPLLGGRRLVAGPRIPRGVENEGLHGRFTTALSAAMRRASRWENTFAIAAAYCSMSCAGWQ